MFEGRALRTMIGIETKPQESPRIPTSMLLLPKLVFCTAGLPAQPPWIRQNSEVVIKLVAEPPPGGRADSWFEHDFEISGVAEPHMGKNPWTPPLPAMV